jgi:hypothetical protein
MASSAQPEGGAVRAFLRKNDPGTYSERLRRARRSGYWRGRAEAKLFRLAVGNHFTRAQGLEWLNTVVDEGRAELDAQHAEEREVERWEMSCRIAFLLEIVS